jgi:osmotically-inducible protein OsmY
MWTDTEIQQDVIDEFVWDPEVTTAEVGVEVDEGVVTLTGTVESYAMKLAAQDAAQRVEGVRAVANDLSVRGPLTYNDTDIAKAVVDALDANFSVPPDRIEVTVQNGKVKLTGEVDWAFQRAAAANSVRYLRGVRDLANLITVKQPQVSAAEVQSGIERALLRAAELDADRIRVRSDGGHVTLSGTVRSYAEKEEATLGAWRARGVTQVTNNIEVRPY